MPSSDRKHSIRKGIVDSCVLVGSALAVCILGGSAFLLADLYHISPLWILVSLISVVFFAGAKEEYRKQFHSARFVAFVCGWVVVNAAVFMFVLGLFGWLWLIPVLIVEQVLYYMTAYWIFGLRPPLGARSQSE